MMETWVGVDAALLQRVESGMYAMWKFRRSLIAAAAALVYASVSATSGLSIAAVTSGGHKASVSTDLSKTGFLDFKTILFSPNGGDNLAGIFNEIKFIGPDMFKGASLSPRVLRKFKSSQRPVSPGSPVFGWDASEINVSPMEEYGNPQSISSELVDALLQDITDQIRNHGVSTVLTPALGPNTTAYFNSAAQQVIDKIEKLENGVPPEPAELRDTGESDATLGLPHPQPVFFFGLGLVAIGLLRRRARKNSSTNAGPVAIRLAPRKASPTALFDAIGKSPIQYPPPHSVQ